MHRALHEISADPLQVFTEAEIRASVVFQLSKLVTLLLKAARLNTGAGAWDAIVAGGLQAPAMNSYQPSDIAAALQAYDEEAAPG